MWEAEVEEFNLASRRPIYCPERVSLCFKLTYGVPQLAALPARPVKPETGGE